MRFPRTANIPLVLAFSALVLVMAGCGGGSGRGKNNRPPIPIVVAVQIGENEVTASPQMFGAGPITLLVSNQTRVPQKLTVDGPRLKRTLPVDSSDTASLKIVPQPGDYTLSLDETQQAKEFTLHVGAKRGSAQNRLLTP